MTGSDFLKNIVVTETNSAYPFKTILAEVRHVELVEISLPSIRVSEHDYLEYTKAELKSRMAHFFYGDILKRLLDLHRSMINNGMFYDVTSVRKLEDIINSIPNGITARGTDGG